MSESQKGRVFSEEHKKHLSEKAIGRKMSEEAKKKMSLFHKGKKTKGSTGMHWWNNGIESVLSYECPEGFVAGRK